MQRNAGQGRTAQCRAGGLANPVAGLLADHIEPIGRRVRDVVLVLVSEVPEGNGGIGPVKCACVTVINRSRNSSRMSVPARVSVL